MVKKESQYLREFIDMGFDTLTENDLTLLLQKTSENLRQILNCKYVAIGILDRGKFINFIQSGFSKETVRKIGGIPQGKGILGEVIKKESVMVVDDIKKHTHFTGFPKHHPEMRNLIAKSIFNGEEKLGRVYAAEKLPGFTSEDKNILELASKLISSSILQVRTQTNLRENAIDLKVSKLKRDLHDSALQNLVALNLQLELFKDQVENTEEQKMLKSSIAISKKVIKGLYEILDAEENKPISFEALNQEILDIITRTEMVSDINIEADLSITENLDAKLATSIITIISEAFSNIVKHSKATKASINLSREGQYINLIIKDNGVGFDEYSVKKGFGLKNIQIRSLEHAGNAKFAIDNGTKIEINLYLKD